MIERLRLGDTDKRMIAQGQASYLFVAVENGADIDVIRGLAQHPSQLRSRGHRGKTPLLLSLQEGELREDVTELLISAGSDVNATDEHGSTPLHSAAYQSLAIVRHLLSVGARVNAQDAHRRTALHEACWRAPASEAVEIVKSLLAAGAGATCEDDDGDTPLHSAAQREEGGEVGVEIVRILLSAGAAVNATNKIGWTPLHCVAAPSIHGPSNYAVADLLIASGANINARDRWNEDILLRAVSRDARAVKDMDGHLRLVQKLLDFGANADYRDSKGQTVCDIALANCPQAAALVAAASKNPDLNKASPVDPGLMEQVLAVRAPGSVMEIAAVRERDPRAIPALLFVATKTPWPGKPRDCAVALVRFGEAVIPPLLDLLETCRREAKNVNEIGDTVEQFAETASVESRALLTAFADRAYPLLVELFEANGSVSGRVGRVLGFLREMPVYDVLLRGLTTPGREHTFDGACMGLGELGDSRAVEPLIESFAEAPTSAAAHALGKLKDRRAVPLLVAYVNKWHYLSGLFSPTGLTLFAAVKSLAEIGDSDAVEALVSLVEQSRTYPEGYEGHHIRASAVRALGRIGGPRADAVVLACLRDATYTVRSVAVAVCGTLNPPGLAEALRPLLSDPYSDIQEAASSLLSAGSARQ